jgi:hypothetical protein
MTILDPDADSGSGSSTYQNQEKAKKMNISSYISDGYRTILILLFQTFEIYFFHSVESTREKTGTILISKISVFH